MSLETLTWPDFLGTITSILIRKTQRSQQDKGGVDRAEEQANIALTMLTHNDFGSLIYAIHRFLATGNLLWLKNWFDNQSLPRLKKHGYEMIADGTFEGED